MPELKIWDGSSWVKVADVDHRNAADPHAQYHTDARGDARYYTQSQVDSSLSGKADTGHTHTLSDVTDSGALAALDTVDTAEIEDRAVTLGKIQDIAASSFLVNGLVLSAPPQALSAGPARAVLGLTDPATASFGTGSGDVAEGDDARFIATRFHPWARPIVAASWFSSQFTGWSAATSGTGSGYMARSEFFTQNFDTRLVTVATADVGTGTSGSNAFCRYHSDVGRVSLEDGLVIAFNTSVVNSGDIQACRIGFAGNATAPSAAGRPTDGIWLEFDRSVSTTDWNLTCGASSTYTAQGTSSAVPSATWEWWAIVYESSSSVKLYSLGTLSATLVATVTTNIPSTNTQRTGQLFFQAEKTNPASSSRAHIQNDLFAILPDADRYPVLP